MPGYAAAAERSDAMTLPQSMPFFSGSANFAAHNDTPREFLERCLSHVEEFEPTVGAFVCHDLAAPRRLHYRDGIVVAERGLCTRPVQRG